MTLEREPTEKVQRARRREQALARRALELQQASAVSASEADVLKLHRRRVHLADMRDAVQRRRREQAARIPPARSPEAPAPLSTSPPPRKEEAERRERWSASAAERQQRRQALLQRLRDEQPSRVAALTALKLGGDVAEANERARAVGGRALLGFEAPGGEQWQRSRVPSRVGRRHDPGVPAEQPQYAPRFAGRDHDRRPSTNQSARSEAPHQQRRRRHISLDGPAVQEERAVAEMKHRVQMEAQQLELEHIQYEREQLKAKMHEERRRAAAAQEDDSSGEPFPLPDPPRASSGGATSQRSDGEGDAHSLPRAPAQSGLGEDVLDVELRTLGPLDASPFGPCMMRVAAVAYLGFKRMHDVRASSSLKEYADVNQAGLHSFSFYQHLALRGIEITYGTNLIFEITVQRIKGGRWGVRGAAQDEKYEYIGHEEIIGWAMASVQENGELVEGAQLAQVWKLPLMLAAHQKSSLGHAMVEFAVRMREHPEDSPPATPAAPPSMAARGAREEDARRNGAHEEGAWRRVHRAAMHNLLPFQPADGCTVCVDGARFLPPNVTISKAVATVYSSARRVLHQASGLAQSSSSSQSPQYAITMMCETTSWDPTATLVIQIETVERETGTVKIAGYSALELFLYSETGEGVASGVFHQRIVLNEGAFQLPMYMSLPQSGPMLAEAMHSLSKVPCATMLVRVLPSSLNSGSIPNYDDRVYDSTRCEPSEAEAAMYKQKLQVRDVMIESEIAKLAHSEGRQMPRGQLQMQQAMEQRLSKDALVNDAMLNFRHVCKFQRFTGFQVAIDGAVNVSGGPAFALHSYAPTAPFYTQSPLERVMGDVNCTQALDAGSSLTNPRWLDDFVAYQDLMYNPNMVVVIDVRSLNEKKRTLQNVGWTILPVFEDNTEYVASGYYHLPLFPGAVSVEILRSLEKATEKTPKQIIEEAIALRKHKPGKSSILVRLLDTQRMGEMDEPATTVNQAMEPPSFLDPKFVGKLKVPKYNAEETKSFARIAPKGMDSGEWIESLADVFQELAFS